MSRRFDKLGFTLIEVMIALFILTIVGVMTSTGLNTAMRTHEHIEEKSKTIHELQLAMMIIEQDIQQIINRPILNEAGFESPAVITLDNYLEFTRSGWINPFEMNERSTLQRVAYLLDDNNLVRISWKVLDRYSRTKIESQLLISNVKSFHIRVLPENNFLINPPPNFLLPYMNVGIQVDIDINGLGQIRRLIPIASTTFGENVNAKI